MTDQPAYLHALATQRIEKEVREKMLCKLYDLETEILMHGRFEEDPRCVVASVLQRHRDALLPGRYRHART